MWFRFGSWLNSYECSWCTNLQVFRTLPFAPMDFETFSTTYMHPMILRPRDLFYRADCTCRSKFLIRALPSKRLDGLGVAFQVHMPEDSASNPVAGSIYLFGEVCPGLGLLPPQWNPYPTLPCLPAECVTSVQSVALSMVWQSVTTHGKVAGDLSSRTQVESEINTVGLSFQ